MACSAMDLKSASGFSGVLPAPAAAGATGTAAAAAALYSQRIALISNPLSVLSGW